MDEEMKALVERGVQAIERLADDPVIQVETRPPVCPWCEQMNPAIRTQESEGTGPLSEFIIQSHCLHCNKVFYAIPVQWDCVKDVNEAQQLISERSDERGFNG